MNDNPASFSQDQLLRLVPLSYPERALRILEQWINSSHLSPSVLMKMIENAYNIDNFDCNKVEEYFTFIITARKRSLRRLCFYRCLSVHTGGGVRGCSGGALVAPGGGMHGCFCVVALGGHAWLLRGACVVALGGHAWLLWGGVRGCSGGGVHGFCWGACMVFSGGVCVVFSRGALGYDEIRSMSGRYASYWNAFLFLKILVFSKYTAW